MTRGGRRPLTCNPGTCGSCENFKRFNFGEGETGSGTCRAKPNLWLVRQSTPACKRNYVPGGQRKI